MRIGDSYTKVVDIWALGTVVHQILTSEIPFLETYEAMTSMTTTPEPSNTAGPAMSTIDYELLYAYCRGSDFPTQSLQRNGVSYEGIDFVKSLMIADPRKRVSAKDALESRWLINSPFVLLRGQFAELSVYLTVQCSSQLLLENDRATIIGLLRSPSPSEIWTMQRKAVSLGYIEAVKVLLKLLDDIDSRPEPERITLLQLAVKKDQIGVMQLLFERNANPNTSGAGQIPLYYAAQNGYTNAIFLLLGKGAKIDACLANRDGQTALHAAAAGGHVRALGLLLDMGASIRRSAPGANGQSALHAAAAGGHLGAIEFLLDQGASIDGYALTKNGQSALHAAAAGGHLEVISFLLTRGAHVDGYAPTANGQLALHAAAGGGHLEAIAVLLDRGAQVNGYAPTANGQLALHAAAIGGHLGAIGLLLDRGARINGCANTKHGQLALQGAMMAGHHDVEQFLLDRGAKISVENVG